MSPPEELLQRVGRSTSSIWPARTNERVAHVAEPADGGLRELRMDADDVVHDLCHREIDRDRADRVGVVFADPEALEEVEHSSGGGGCGLEIGRASCRERV